MWDAVYRTSKMTSNSILGWEEPLALAWDADFQKCVQQENPDIIVSGINNYMLACQATRMLQPCPANASAPAVVLLIPVL
jgi:hypothetical protein